MREKLLSEITQLAARRPGFMFTIALVLTAIAAGVGSRLELKMHAKKSHAAKTSND